MKKFFALFVCLSALFAGNVVAQEKGDVYAGGSLGLGISSVGQGDISATSVSFSMTPEIGYFIADNCRLGAELSFAISEGVSTFAFQPTFAYYVKLMDNLYYTPEFKIGGGFAASENYTTGLFTFGLDLFALEFMPSEKLAISLSLVNLTYNLLPEGPISTFNFSLMSTPQVGVRYYF